jgi:flagellar hook-associated protein 3 FlgL
MSSTIGVTGTGYGIIGTLIANSTTVHQQLDTLTEQASTGLVSQTYAGLGGGASISLNLNPQLNTLQTAQNNINEATGSMQVTQTAMTQIQQIAATFVSDMPNLNTLDSSEVDSVAANARQALSQVASLLDTQDGDNYVFAGQDSSNPPVPSPEGILSSGFYTQINAAVSALSTNGELATTTATLAIAGSNVAGTSPFSAYMSQPASSTTSSGISAPIVQTGEGGTVQIGLLASANSVAVSTGSSTTGSYMRDLMRALATIGSMSSSQADDPGFDALVQDTTTSLNGVVSAMATDVGVLGNTQSNLTSIQTQLSDTSTALSGQVSNVQDVDMATTLSNLTATQTQLQASYRLITGETSLSLVNFLPTSA